MEEVAWIGTKVGYHYFSWVARSSMQEVAWIGTKVGYHYFSWVARSSMQEVPGTIPRLLIAFHNR